MSMLPRHEARHALRPRDPGRDRAPGPIQGDMVHPYLRRREGLEKPEYPEASGARARAWARRLGVPLFQEQAMQVAISLRRLHGHGEADQLRRAMATFKVTGGVSRFRDKLIDGMVAQRLHRRFRRAHLQADRGFRILRLPRKPRRQLRADRLRQFVDEMPPPRRVLRRVAERPADGVLRARADRPRRGSMAWTIRPVCVNASRGTARWSTAWPRLREGPCGWACAWPRAWPTTHAAALIPHRGDEQTASPSPQDAHGARPWSTPVASPGTDRRGGPASPASGALAPRGLGDPAGQANSPPPRWRCPSVLVRRTANRPIHCSPKPVVAVRTRARRPRRPWYVRRP